MVFGRIGVDEIPDLDGRGNKTTSTKVISGMLLLNRDRLVAIKGKEVTMAQVEPNVIFRIFLS